MRVLVDGVLEVAGMGRQVDQARAITFRRWAHRRVGYHEQAISAGGPDMGRHAPLTHGRDWNAASENDQNRFRQPMLPI